ncbi:MAG TPA: hypothetical protein VNG94_06025, partial [Pyrinomonadaceae bacterium]|nr:hypothetical protein [Pyrinomonadaceae bacterium]
AIPSADARYGVDLRQNGICTLIVARDRHPFTASGILSIAHTDCYDTRFCAAAARNPERLLQWKDFLRGLDFQSDEVIRERREHTRQFQN